MPKAFAGIASGAGSRNPGKLRTKQNFWRTSRILPVYDELSASRSKANTRQISGNLNPCCKFEPSESFAKTDCRAVQDGVPMRDTDSSLHYAHMNLYYRWRDWLNLWLNFSLRFLLCDFLSYTNFVGNWFEKGCIARKLFAVSPTSNCEMDYHRNINRVQALYNSASV